MDRQDNERGFRMWRSLDQPSAFFGIKGRFMTLFIIIGAAAAVVAIVMGSSYGSMIGMLVIYGLGGTVATAATLVYHAISLWVPALWGTIAFIALQRTKKQPVILRNPTEELHPRSH
jgi:hypothetical protein